MRVKRKLLALVAIGALLVGMMPTLVLADSENYISKQPTAANPTVVVSDSDNASFQWYEANVEEVATIKALSPEVMDGAIYALGDEENTEENGVWQTTDGWIVLDCVLMSGDILQVIPCEGFAGSLSTGTTGEYFVVDENGVYSYTVTSDYDLAHAYISWSEEDEYTAQVQVVRGENTYPVIDAQAAQQENEKYQRAITGVYNGQEWESKLISGLTNGNYDIRIELRLEEGEVLKIVPDENFDGRVAIDQIDNVVVLEAVDGVYYYEVSNTRIYHTLYLSGTSAFTAQVTSCQYVLGEEVEGQNTATLTEAEQGKVYACKITYPNGAVLMSEYVTIQYQITKQPTAGNPTVGLNFQKGASYQWYEVVENKVALTNENIITVAQDTYMGTDGLWYGSEMIGVIVNVEEGNVITITPTDDALIDIVAVGYDAPTYLESNNGVYEYVAEETGDHTILLQCLGDVGVKLEVSEIDLGEELENETSATLQGGEYGKSYLCKVTWENGVVKNSNIVTITEAISMQPTASKPEVAVNFPDSVDSYQWYLVDKILMPIANYAYVYEDGVGYASDCYAGTYENGLWYSEVVETNSGADTASVYSEASEDSKMYSLSMRVKVEQGDSVVITPTDDGEIDISDISAYTSSINRKVQDGSYICEANESGELYFTLIRDVEFSAEVTLVKPDGTIYEIQNPYDYEGNGAIEGISYGGTYKDGMWVSVENEETGSEITQVLFVALTLKKGDVLQVTPEADFSGEVYIFDYVSLTQEGICLAEVNGVYQHELEASGTYVLVLGDTEEFTAKIEVPGEVLSTAVEGQTTATLKNHKAGSYACVVTLKDGTKLVSETVELTDADITHTYDDEYDADCNGCGATREVPERPDNSDTDENQNGDNISNKGDAQMNLFCVMGFVLLGVGLLGLKKNKYIQ